MLIETLHTQHFTHVPLRMSTSDLEEGARLYLEFLENVPQEAKRTVHFKSPFHRGSATGYCDVRISSKENPKDPKEYFHWNPLIECEEAYRRLYKHDATAAAFFDKAKYIYKQAEQMAYLLFRYELPEEIYDRCFQGEHLLNGHLRFLCYTPGPYAFKAKGHYDKGSGTLALAESCPGLRIGCCGNHPLTPVVHEKESALFMPGQLLWEDLKGAVIPAWHDVEHVPGTKPISARCARWAIVLFINDKDGRYPSWESTHRPLPVHEPWREVAAA